MVVVPVSRHPAQIARIFDRLFDGAFEADTRKPALDVAEADAAYTVKVDLPGVAKEDVKISIEGKRVGIQAQPHVEAEAKEGDAGGDRVGERIVYRERPAAKFSRSFVLPQEIDQAASNAKLEHGVLTLSLAKRRADSAAQLTVN